MCPVNHRMWFMLGVGRRRAISLSMPPIASDQCRPTVSISALKYASTSIMRKDAQLNRRDAETQRTDSYVFSFRASPRECRRYFVLRTSHFGLHYSFFTAYGCARLLTTFTDFICISGFGRSCPAV